MTFLGAGSAFSKKYFQNNLILVKGDTHIMVDCGGRAPEALALLGVPITDIRTFLITHTHADHIGGLEEVMLQNRYVAKRKAKIIITDKLKLILWGSSLRGGAAWNEIHDGKPLTFTDFWDQIVPKRVRGAEREFSTVTEGGIELGLYRTMHIPDSAKTWEDSFPSYCIVIDRRVLFTSDTRFDQALVLDLDKEYGLETIFHDCQFFKGGVHAGLEELASLPKAIKAKTWLMHYGDGMETKREAIRDLGFAGFAEEWATYSFPGTKPLSS